MANAFLLGKLRRPLLGKRSDNSTASLNQLFVVVALQCISFCVAMLPAFSLRFRELAAIGGMDAAEVAASLGRVTAVRNVVEFVAAPVWAACSDRAGRRPVLILITAALCAQFVTFATANSLLALSSAYVAFGAFSDPTGAIAGTCIADAVPAGSARAVAFARLYTVVGVAMVLGPWLGGMFAGIDGRLPFAVGGALCAGTLGYTLHRLPEYSQGGRSKERAGPGPFMRMLVSAPALKWYVSAYALSALGMGAFGSVQVLWLRTVFGWEAQSVGRFMSASGLELIASQCLLLPRLLRCFQEAPLVQLALAVTAGKLVVFALVQEGISLYLVLAAAAVGSCSGAPLRSLCTGCAQEAQQGSLAGGLSAVSTAAQVFGSLLGSQLFALSLREQVPTGAFLGFGAVCYVLASACVARGAPADVKRAAA